jgi:acetolactate synthase-1/2/3 large subunit
VRHRIPFVTVVGNDAGWGQIRTPQKTLYGADCTVGTDLAPTRYDRVVAGMGGWGAHVEQPDEIGPALRAALDQDVPACVNVRIAPDVVPGSGYMRGL